MAKKAQRPSKTGIARGYSYGLSKRLSTRPFKRNRLSIGHLLAFAVAFAFIGSYAIYQSFAAAPGYSSKTSGVITGTVTDAQEEPIAGAIVSVTVNGAKRTYTTSSKGLYYIPALPQGSYSLSFSADNYDGATVSSTATNGKMTIKDVNLPAQ